MGMVFKNVLKFPDLWAQSFVKIHLLVSCFGIVGFMGMVFGKYSGFMGILLRKLSGLMGYF